MSLPAETRLALLELHKNYRFVMQESVQCLYTAYAVLEDMGPKLQTLTDSFTWEIHTIGSEAYTQEISNFHIDPNVPCRIQPLLMLPATYLFINTLGADGHLVVYCGILRYALRNMELSAEIARNQIYESIRLLGDRTRFDIFCYLKDHPAYGQELSSHFGLARNTIHYHMSQLFKARLVRCTVEGGQNLLLHRQRSLQQASGTAATAFPPRLSNPGAPPAKTYRRRCPLVCVLLLST